MTAFPRHWPWLALLASLLMLAIAHAFETFGHLSPCELCLKQRDIYWGAAAFCALGLAWRATRRPPDPTRLLDTVLVLIFLVSALVAFYHAGVEWKLWAGPASCSGGAARVDPAEMARLLSGARMTLPSCDRPAWVFLGLSMAAWNGLASLILAALSAVASLAGEPKEKAPA